MKKSFIYRFRWPIIVFAWVSALAFGLAIPSIRIDPKVEGLIPDKMESKVNTDKLEEIFGGTDMIMIIMESDDILNAPTLERLRKIDEGFSALPEIERSLSLFSLKSIKGIDGSMVVDPALPLVPSNEAEKEDVKRLIRDNELVYGVVISKDFRYAAIIGTVQKETDNKVLLASVKEVVDNNPGPEKIYFGGYPVVAQSIVNNIIKDLRILLPMAILLILVILILSFRDFKGVFLPLSVVFLSLIVSLGLMPIIGWKFALVSVLLPVMMIAIGNNYGIYLVNRYLEIIRHKPGIETGELMADLSKALNKPILLCALTTIAGVLGLLAHIIVPAREVGLLAAIGISWALILSLTYIPAALSVMPRSRVRLINNKPHITPLEHFLFRTGVALTRKPVYFLVILGIITAGTGIGMYRLTVEGNTVNFFNHKDPVRQTSELIDRNFGGSQTISLMFTGDVKNPELLKRMDYYETVIKERKGVGQVVSMASVIRLMSKALVDPGDPGYNKIPDTREGVAQYLELYNMSGDPSDFEQLVDFGYEHAQLMVRINDASSSAVLGLVDFIKNMTRDDHNVEMIAGIGLISAEMTNSLVKGQWRSSIFAIVVVCILVGFIFGTWSASLLVLVPLGMACIILFGIMGWLGIPFDPATTLITSVMIGCGVDYTVQYLWRQRSEMAAGLSQPRAVIKTLYTTGKAILFNALAVMIGFSPLIFSTFSPIRFFGTMMLVSIFACLIGALVVIPAVNLVVKPGFLAADRRQRTAKT